MAFPTGKKQEHMAPGILQTIKKLHVGTYDFGFAFWVKLAL